MTYNELRAAPLADLASMALDTDRAPVSRLGPWEALLARVGETGTDWAGLDSHERDTIRRAAALDLSRHGFTV